MRLFLSTCLLVAASLPAHAAGEDKPPPLSSRQCGVSTRFDVLVDSGGLWLRQRDAAPREIFIHDGELSIDRRLVSVSAADAQRLRQLEAGAHRLMPAVTGIARESVDLAFEAVGMTVEILSGSARKQRQVTKMREDAQAYIDQTLGRGRWEQEFFDEGFEARVEAAAESLASSLGRSMMWAMFTGGTDRIEARADKLEAELEPRIEQRGAALRAQAEALCQQVRDLDRIQQALEVRYQGQPLALLQVDGGSGMVVRDGNGDAGDTAR